MILTERVQSTMAVTRSREASAKPQAIGRSPVRLAGRAEERITEFATKYKALPRGDSQLQQQHGSGRLGTGRRRVPTPCAGWQLEGMQVEEVEGGVTALRSGGGELKR